MKSSNKSKKDSAKPIKINSIQQFKELYYPSMTEKEKKKEEEDKSNYGSIIAMSILDGINRDLNNPKK